MNKEERYRTWINKCINKFGDKFGYELVVYNNANSKVIIDCSNHGQIAMTPWNHLHSKHGCSKCGDEAMGFQQRIQSQVNFWSKVSDIYGETYDYSLVSFQKITDKIKVICQKHGEFQITADHHMRGVKCSKCANEQQKGAYTESWFNFDPRRKAIDGLFYLVQMDGNDESFLKIGITRHSVEHRYKGGKYKPTILETRTGNLYKVFKFEEKIKTLSQYRYYPKLGMRTESFATEGLDWLKCQIQRLWNVA